MCTVCKYKTNDPVQFTRHWLSHEERSFINANGVYACQISGCLYVAPSEEDILKHVASQHLCRYRCGFCYYVTFSKNEYDEHRITHCTYQCEKCDLQSTKYFFVQDHVESPFKCNVCDFTAHHWLPYKKHINRHEYLADSVIECGFCDFTTRDHLLLETHKAVHFMSSIIPCKLCSFMATYITELDKHYRKDHDTTFEAVDKLHKCRFCTCKFIGLGSKEKHEELHVKNDALLKCCSSFKNVQCPYCDHQDIERNAMISHIVSKHTAALELDGFRYENASDEIVHIAFDLTNFGGCDEYREEHEEQEANTKECEESIRIFYDIAEDCGNEKLDKMHADNACTIILRCTMCPHRSNDTFDFDQHLITTHNTSKPDTKVFTFCCSRCPFTTKNEALLRSHLSLHCRQKNGNKLKSKQYLHPPKTSYRKLKSISKIVLFCELCQFKTTNKVLYDAHLNSHQKNSTEGNSTEQGLKKKVPQYTCSFCYHAASSKEDYDVHYKTHTTFKCNKCSFRATKRLFVEDHIENPWGCSKCNFNTHHWLPMISHSFGHKNQSTILKCLECDFETRKPGVLKSHWLTHKTEHLRCKVCLYTTISENELQVHYAELHSGDPLDDASLSTDDRPYECDLCACKFKQQVYLDRHRTLHGENGPFRLNCGQCSQGKNCTTSGKVENDGYKPDSWSKCPYCSYEDERRYRMIGHLAEIHQKRLEIEGYQFDDDDDQTDEIIPDSSTSIENDPVQMTSHSAEVEENSMSSANCTNLPINAIDTSTSTSSKIPVTRCSFCSFTSDQGSQYIQEHILNEHVQRLFRCSICGCTEKEMRLINKHIHKEHPPLTTYDT
ncbi:unnamed protein product, partial [Callosobruchus maculatus]